MSGQVRYFVCVPVEKKKSRVLMMPGVSEMDGSADENKQRRDDKNIRLSQSPQV